MIKNSRLVFCILLFSLYSSIGICNDVKVVNFLSQYGMKVNAAGPLFVKSDTARNRIVLINTNTSSVSLINAKTYAVINIPIANRVPQYLKMEAVTIDNRTGNIYVIGTKSLHIVIPEKQNSVTIPTAEQYEMVAVNENNGDAFLVSRESKDLVMISFKSQQPKRIPWVEKVEQMINLNQTPPPPIRKVFCDTGLQQVIALDGDTATLTIFSTDSGALVSTRKLSVAGGTRWHFAGYDQLNHYLYVVVETRERKVNEAVKIDIARGKDTIIVLPGLTEGVGVIYNPKTEEVYIPYDNHPTVHVVDFKNGGKIEEIKIPTYGNDASILDEKNARLYVSNWGYAEIEVIDLQTRKLLKRIQNVGIIPHMFNMALNTYTGELVIPLGATAVNGSFGASLTILNPETEKMHRIYTGWAPVAIVKTPGKDSYLVFNSEDQAAEITPDGKCSYHTLPVWLINNAIETPTNQIYISYGPHQSYWPAVYIWGAKNGIMSTDYNIKTNRMSFYDRRIPRMAQQMVVDNSNALYATQNNWGDEKQFLFTLPDEVRVPNLDQTHLELNDIVVRETTQRILKYDKDKNWLYIARVGETDEEPGILQIYDLTSKKIVLKYPLGLTPTDLIFDAKYLYVSDFDSNTITAVSKDDFTVKKFKTGNKPFKLALLNNSAYWINHNDNSLQAAAGSDEIKTYQIPNPGKPDALFSTGKDLIITSHSQNALFIHTFSPANGSIKLLYKFQYPYGDTSVDTNNSSFYLRGQFADGIYELNHILQDSQGRLWIIDYLSGSLIIVGA
jgi:DNA-binding beta-propeller fold protein YncE